MDRQTGIGMKEMYLMLIFKIVLLESSEVETDYLMTDGRKIVQTDRKKKTDRRKQFIKFRYLGDTFTTKKRIFKTGLLERHLSILSFYPSV